MVPYHLVINPEALHGSAKMVDAGRADKVGSKKDILLSKEAV